MKRLFVLDASIAAAWCFDDEASDIAKEALFALRSGVAVVPPTWLHDVANVMVIAERRGRIKWSTAEQFLSTLGKLPIEVDAATSQRISAAVIALARQCGLSYYDAAYLEVAARRGLPLATADAALLRAMQRVGVPAWQPRSDMVQEEEAAYAPVPLVRMPVYYR